MGFDMVDCLGDRVGGHRLLAGSSGRPEGPQLLLYFLFSLVFFPAALIVAYMVHDRRAAYA